MQILHTDSHIIHIICQVLRHTLGQSCHQYFMMLRNLLVNLGDQVIYLPLHGTYIHLRIQQSCRADDLLRTEQFMGSLILRRRGGNKQHLIDMLLKFLEIKRPVIQRRRQPETIIHKRGLP